MRMLVSTRTRSAAIGLFTREAAVESRRSRGDLVVGRLAVSEELLESDLGYLANGATLPFSIST